MEIVQAYLGVQTHCGKGSGYVRLMPDTTYNGKWKAFTPFTCLESLDDYPERLGTRRPTGHERNPQHEHFNWKQQREVEQNLEGTREPAVLIIGKSDRMILGCSS